MRRLLLVLAILLAAGWGWLSSKNPESRRLDEAARATAGGSFAHLSDGVTHYEVAGPDSGPRVMLVHGFSVPSYIWDSTFAALTNAGYRVARYDTYGRGWSDRPDTRYTFTLYDRQLLELLDTLGWREPVHVMGLSYGGPITATFVGRHPERVRTHIMVDPAAGASRQVPWYIKMPVIGPLLWQGLVVPTMADGQASDFVNPAPWPDWADKYRVQQQFTGFGRALRASILDNAGVRYDSVYAAAGKSAKPTLLFWGTEDRTVKIANAASVRAGIPQTEYHPIEKAGHLPHMEQAKVVDSVLTKFLRRYGPTTPNANPEPKN